MAMPSPIWHDREHEGEGYRQYPDEPGLDDGVCPELLRGNIHLRGLEIRLKLSPLELVDLNVLCEKVRKTSEPCVDNRVLVLLPFGKAFDRAGGLEVRDPHGVSQNEE